MSIIRRASGKALNLGGHFFPPEAFGESRDLLSALFKSSTVGVAICDRQLRFRVVNDALASMNGLPAAAHLGKTIHAVLGSAAAKVQPVFEHVFATGEPLSNFELTAVLPTRTGEGRWNENYFPIKDRAGKVQQVGAVVLELTKREDLDHSLSRLTDTLSRVCSVLRNQPNALDPSVSHNGCARLTEVFAHSVELLENCMSETHTLSHLLQSAPALTAVQPLRPPRIRHAQSSERPGTPNSASVHSIEEELEYAKPLSSRECEVVTLLAAGRTNKETATILMISTRTVESHRAKIMLKLDLHSISDLVRYAVRKNLIQP